MAEAQKLNVVFMGTPDFAATILDALVAWDGCTVSAVYTQPDRPCGRGLACRPSAVKELALTHNLPVYQPLNFKNDADVDALAALQPDVLIVAAYGLILPQRVLDIAPKGAINVHASLLPRYRGAAPIQRAIMNGDPVTGISIMQMEAGLDSGPVILQRALAIGIDDTTGTLHDELAKLGGVLLVEALEKVRSGGEIRLWHQDPERVTHAAKLSKAEGEVDWNSPAAVVHARIRGVSPWPGAYFTLEREGQKALRVGMDAGVIGKDLETPVPAGTVLGLEDDKLAVACADKCYYIANLRPANKKPMDAKAFYCGYLASCSHAVCAPCEKESEKSA